LGVVGGDLSVLLRILPALQATSGCIVIGIASPLDDVHARSLSTRFGISWCYDSLDAMLEHAEIDAVFISTPPGSHIPLGASCIRARKPVVFERNMGRTAEEARELMAAFGEASLPVFVTHHRLSSRFLLAQQLMRHIGVVSSVQYICCNARATALAFDAAQCRSHAAAVPWQVDVEQSGGGMIMQYGREAFDALDMIMGPLVRAEEDGGDARERRCIERVRHCCYELTSLSGRIP
jgi:predicted dehydrogenase